MATNTAAPRGTYENPLELATPYGAVALQFHAWPTAPYLDERSGSTPRLRKWDCAPHVGASLRTPQPPESIAPRGYIDGRAAYYPLTINGIPYRVESYFTDEAGPFALARSQGYYTSLKRLQTVGADDTGRQLAVVTFEDEPTVVARRVAYREIEPLVVEALNSGDYAAEIDAARWRAVESYQRGLDALRTALEAVEIDARAAGDVLRSWAGTIPEADPGEANEPPLHAAAVLTGGSIPAHYAGAYPRLSCCGGPVQLVEAVQR